MRVSTDISGIWVPFARQASFRDRLPIHTIPAGKAATLYIKPNGTGVYENEKKPLFGEKSSAFSYHYLGDYFWDLRWLGGIGSGDQFGLMTGGPVGDMSILLDSVSADYQARRIMMEKQVVAIIFDSMPAGHAMYYYRSGDWS